MKWLFSRLREPSTWAGFAAFLPAAIGATAGAPLTPQLIGGLVGGFAAVLMPERKA